MENKNIVAPKIRNRNSKGHRMTLSTLSCLLKTAKLLEQSLRIYIKFSLFMVSSLAVTINKSMHCWCLELCSSREKRHLTSRLSTYYTRMLRDSTMNDCTEFGQRKIQYIMYSSNTTKCLHITCRSLQCLLLHKRAKNMLFIGPAVYS